MISWNLQIREETDRTVRNYLAVTAEQPGDLSEFVDQAVRAEVLRRTVREIQDQNSALSSEDAQQLADEAVAWARANTA
ncbi:MAG: hypothetical protein HYV27_18460 [Candidatus Hydrogenedentes bacterium]|nr:hypothetical protein [Candidatus Hydrogenedentota bacterium]